VPNRFTGRIRRGEIASVAELKAEFKALAKLHHPDTAGPGGRGEDFAALRAEYEAALHDFDLHRFGLGKGGTSRHGGRTTAAGGTSAGGGGVGGNPFVSSVPVWDRKAFYEALGALRKRGFPKLPRHEKERMRYEYRRFLVLALLAAWDAEHPGRFRAFEARLLELGGEGPASAALAILDGLLDYHARGTELVRASLALELRRFRTARPGVEGEGRGRMPAGEGAEEALAAFLALLVEDAAKGAAHRAEGREPPGPA
jgi:hypothetical protein